MAVTKRILIVEDDLPLLNALAETFEKEGFQVLKAQDGEGGLKVALKESPDLILLDIIMPKMHGWQMLEKLREDSWGKKVMVIVLSNISDPQKKEQFMETGQVVDYLVKTELRLQDVVHKVKERLGIA